MVTEELRGDRTLLIIDDDRAIGDLIARVARESGFVAVVLTDPVKFMKEFDRLQPRVVTIDMLMPDVDGIELVDWIVQRRSDVRILIVSGSDPLYAEIADLMATAKGSQGVEFLPKPLDVRVLRELLASV